MGAPGNGGIRGPGPGPGGAAEGGHGARRAALGWLVQAVFQAQTEPGDLFLQLSDGLAGVGQGAEMKVTMPQAAATPRAARMPPACPFPSRHWVQLCPRPILELPGKFIFLATYLDLSLSLCPCTLGGQSSTSFEGHPTQPRPTQGL